MQTAEVITAIGAAPAPVSQLLSRALGARGAEKHDLAVAALSAGLKIATVGRVALWNRAGCPAGDVVAAALRDAVKSGAWAALDAMLGPVLAGAGLEQHPLVAPRRRINAGVALWADLAVEHGLVPAERAHDARQGSRASLHAFVEEWVGLAADAPVELLDLTASHVLSALGELVGRDALLPDHTLQLGQDGGGVLLLSGPVALPSPNGAEVTAGQAVLVGDEGAVLAGAPLLRASVPGPGAPATVEVLADGGWRDLVSGAHEPEPTAMDGLAAFVSEGARPRAERAPAPRPTSNLPVLQSACIGRGDAVARLVADLKSDRRLVTITGPGGAGKTRLALELARSWRDEVSPAGGVWFTDASGVFDSIALVAAVAAVLDYPFQGRGAVEGGEAAAIIQVGQALRARGEMLLVVDGVERVLDAARQVLPRWLEQAPDLRVVATSQQALRLDAERLLPLGALDDEDGVRLFVERAREARPDFALADADLPVVTELVRRLDGLPLAIELAAARSRVLPPGRILERLSERFDLLRDRDAGRGRGNLREVLDWSWGLLDRFEQRALVDLSVFPASFTVEAAEAVVGLEEWDDAPWEIDVLEALQDKSFIHVVPGEAADEMRLGLFHSIREYAAERARDEGLGAAQERFVTFTLDLGERLAARSTGDDAVSVLPVLTAELPNLLAVSDRMAARDPSRAARALLAACPALARGPQARQVQLLDSLLDAEVDLMPEHRLALLLESGIAHRTGSDHDGAEQRLREAVDLARDQGDLAGRATARASLALTLRDQGRAEEALVEARGAVALAREVGATPVLATAMSALGNLLRRAGELEEAEEALREAVDLARRGPDRRRLAMAEQNLGTVLWERERVDEALEHYEAAAAGYRAVDERRYLASVHVNLANDLAMRGRYDDVAHHIDEALVLSRQIGDRRNEALCLVNHGLVGIDEGRLELAEARLDEGRAVADTYGVGFAGALARLNRGMLAHARQDLGGALRELAEAERRFEGSGLGWAVGYVRLHQGAVLADLDRIEDAQAAFDEVPQRLPPEQHGNPNAAREVALAHLDLARARAAPEQAEEYLEAARQRVAAGSRARRDGHLLVERVTDQRVALARAREALARTEAQLPSEASPVPALPPAGPQAAPSRRWLLGAGLGLGAMGAAGLGVFLRGTEQTGRTSETRTIHTPEPETRSTRLGPAGRYGGVAGYDRRFAVLIGVQNYIDDGVRDLRTPLHDVDTVAATLAADFGFQTALPDDEPGSLVLHDPTRDEVARTLNRVVKTVGEGDAVLIYYAGHSDIPDNLDQAYWLLSDAEAGDTSRWFSADEIRATVKRMPARSVLVISDSCFSGALTREVEGSTSADPDEARERFLARMTRDRARILFASGAKEPVLDGGGGEHSIFARALIDRLGSVESAAFTSEELFGPIQEKVAGNSNQAPQRMVIRNSSHDGGDFVFFRVAGEE